MKKVLVVLVLILLFVGCATQYGFEEVASVAKVGFWRGLWHGIIAPIAWIISLFNKDVAIYAVYNNGGWYDFGFMLGIGALSFSSTTVAGKNS